MADWRSNDYYQKLRVGKVDPKDLEFFKSEPSTRKWLEHAQYSPIITAARLTITDREDVFLNTTLKTDDTISHWLALVSDLTFPHPGKSSQTQSSRRPSGPENPEVLIFFHLCKGVNSFRDTAHGGLLCTLLDETLATVVELYRQTSSPNREELYTARLDISYRRPVKTPAVYIAKAWLEQREGRKWIVKGLLESSQGEICCNIDGLWVAARPQRL
ncbi:hypothetical protein RBB50_001983 [Rhinocladiella similis]